MKNEYYYVIVFIMALLVFYIITGVKPNDNSHPYFKNDNMPIKLICSADLYLCMEDYIYDNFRDLEIIFFFDDAPFIKCEKHVYYVCLVSIPYVINTKQYYEYKKALIDDDNDIHKLSEIARTSPFLSQGSNVAFLNTEHLSNKLYLNHINKYVPSTMHIYDFSKKNTELLGKGTYIPYRNNPISVNILKMYMKQNKRRDLCIIGHISERRKNIIDKMIDAGICVEVIHDDFRTSRDIRAGRCKLLLNVHMHAYTNNYEAIRCERWRFAGMPIISETCIDKVPEGIITCDYDKILETVKDVLRKMNN